MIVLEGDKEEEEKGASARERGSGRRGGSRRGGVRTRVTESERSDRGGGEEEVGELPDGRFEDAVTGGE